MLISGLHVRWNTIVYIFFVDFCWIAEHWQCFVRARRVIHIVQSYLIHKCTKAINVLLLLMKLKFLEPSWWSDYSKLKVAFIIKKEDLWPRRSWLIDSEYDAIYNTLVLECIDGNIIIINTQKTHLRCLDVASYPM